MEVLIDGVKYVPIPDVPHDKGLLSALEIRFNSDAGENITVRDYLRVLLETLYREGESFSGKRPFGNSGWQGDLYAPLISSGVLKGKLDEDGYVEECDETAADAYILKLITAAFHGVSTA